MSGFTTFNAAGFGAGGASGNVAFSYDPLYTASVPTQNIPSGTTDVVYRPGSFTFASGAYGTITNPQAPWSTYNFPVAAAKNKRIQTFGTDNFTVEAWINPISVNGGGILSSSTGSTTNQWLFSFNLGRGRANSRINFLDFESKL